jgi:hypothetical protein
VLTLFYSDLFQSQRFYCPKITAKNPLISTYQFLENIFTGFSCANPKRRSAVAGSKEASGLAFARAMVLSSKAGRTRGI